MVGSGDGHGELGPGGLGELDLGVDMGELDPAPWGSSTPAAWGSPRSAAATVLAVGEWLWSSVPSGGPFVETQKDRAKTHIWVLPQLRRKMGHGFASSVGVCFVSQKHCVQPIFGFGSRYASAVGDSLRGFEQMIQQADKDTQPDATTQ